MSESTTAQSAGVGWGAACQAQQAGPGPWSLFESAVPLQAATITIITKAFNIW